MKDLIPPERIERAILFIHGHKVMLDRDLAELYDIETKVLNRAVKRNRERFPADFTLRLTIHEVKALRCQSGTANIGRGEHRYAFTEHELIWFYRSAQEKQLATALVTFIIQKCLRNWYKSSSLIGELLVLKAWA
jgi:hypothetical protein